MISIITPTYNRGYIIHEAYNSLCRQSKNEFEWIVVDDGSTDNTEEIVKTWAENESRFEIHYIKQNNGGKHRAVNRGVREARYGFVMVLDSDDFLTEDAVEMGIRWINSIQNWDGFAGVAGLRGWKSGPGAIGGDLGKNEYIDAAYNERRKYGLSGDKAEIFRKEILIKYPYPEFPGEKFLRESAAWDKIAIDGYRMRWFNHIIYYCEYLADGLTKNASLGKCAENFLGFTYCTKLYLLAYPFPFTYFKIGQYDEVAKMRSMNDVEICKELNINKLELTLGRFIYLLAKIKRRLFGTYLKYKP